MLHLGTGSGHVSFCEAVFLYDLDKTRWVYDSSVQKIVHVIWLGLYGNLNIFVEMLGLLTQNKVETSMIQHYCSNPFPLFMLASAVVAHHLF